LGFARGDSRRGTEKMKPAVGVLLGVVLAASVPPALGQAAGMGPAFTIRIAETIPSAGQTSGAIFREIDDPSTGDRWLLERDAFHPEGPGRWLLVAARRTSRQLSPRRDGASPGASETAYRQLPVIRPGDELIAEEHTAVVDARLEAVALGAAASGAEFPARLKIGGKVVALVAVAPGRAAFAAQKGIRR